MEEESHEAACVCVSNVKQTPCVLFIQGFEGTLVWESQDSAGLTTVNSSSVQLNDGGGVLKISSVRSNVSVYLSVCILFEAFKCKVEVQYTNNTFLEIAGCRGFIAS